MTLAEATAAVTDVLDLVGAAYRRLDLEDYVQRAWWRWKCGRLRVFRPEVIASEFRIAAARALDRRPIPEPWRCRRWLNESERWLPV